METWKLQYDDWERGVKKLLLSIIVNEIGKPAYVFEKSIFARWRDSYNSKLVTLLLRAFNILKIFIILYKNLVTVFYYHFFNK